MDDSSDMRFLLGSYVCGEQPGSFEWRDGPLTHAVRTGQWLLLEDIDAALGGQDDAEQPIVLQARDEHQGELFFNEFVDIVSPCKVKQKSGNSGRNPDSSNISDTDRASGAGCCRQLHTNLPCFVQASFLKFATS